jgi:hypothetical protein
MQETEHNITHVTSWSIKDRQKKVIDLEKDELCLKKQE